LGALSQCAPDLGSDPTPPPPLTQVMRGPKSPHPDRRRITASPDEVQLATQNDDWSAATMAAAIATMVNVAVRIDGEAPSRRSPTTRRVSFWLLVCCISTRDMHSHGATFHEAVDDLSERKRSGLLRQPTAPRLTSLRPSARLVPRRQPARLSSGRSLGVAAALRGPTIAVLGNVRFKGTLPPTTHGNKVGAGTAVTAGLPDASDPILGVCSRLAPHRPVGTAFPTRTIDAERTAAAAAA